MEKADSIQILAAEQAKALRNLELVVIESLGKVVESLGFVESLRMVELRENFRLIRPQATEEISQQVGNYLDLGRRIADRDLTSNAILALNILLISFYIPRQNEAVREEFTVAFEDAIESARHEGRTELVGKLTQLYSRIPNI